MNEKINFSPNLKLVDNNKDIYKYYILIIKGINNI